MNSECVNIVQYMLLKPSVALFINKKTYVKSMKLNININELQIDKYNFFVYAYIIFVVYIYLFI